MMSLVKSFKVSYQGSLRSEGKRRKKKGGGDLMPKKRMSNIRKRGNIINQARKAKNCWYR